MFDCNENMVLRYIMPKNSRDKHNYWRHRRDPSTSWIL